MTLLTVNYSAGLAGLVVTLPVFDVLPSAPVDSGKVVNRVVAMKEMENVKGEVKCDSAL